MVLLEDLVKRLRDCVRPSQRLGSTMPKAVSNAANFLNKLRLDVAALLYDVLKPSY